MSSVFVKEEPEFSDEPNTVYLQPDQVLTHKFDADRVILCGQNLVDRVFHASLEKCMGCHKIINGVVFVACHKKSDIMKREGRAKAYSMVVDANKRMLGLSRFDIEIGAKNIHELKTVKDISDDVTLIGFDIETFGKNGIRCITFCTQNQVFYVDCRDLKTNFAKAMLIEDVFGLGLRKENPVTFVGHYIAHDIGLLKKNKVLVHDIPLQDTILFRRTVEFRNLNYLAGVFLGAEYYKDELDIANAEQDFDKLVKYCAKDSFYSRKLFNNNEFFQSLYPSRVVNACVNMCVCPRVFELWDDEFYEKYPDLKGLSRTNLKKHFKEIAVADIQTFKKLCSSHEVSFTYHGLDGIKCVVSDMATDSRGRFYAISPKKEKSLDEVMLNDARFQSPVLSVLRDRADVVPTIRFANYDVEPWTVVAMNDSLCVTNIDYDDSFPITMDQIKGVFHG